MAFDDRLAHRIREVLAERDDVVEQRMFGGLAFMLRGHMCCGIVGDDLMVRVGADQHDDAIARPHVRPMDFTGRPMRGMVYVAPGAIRTAATLRTWIHRGISYAESLPAKPRRSRKR